MLTVAICTHDRARLLRKALASMAMCGGIDEPWELLVVANACTDSTPLVVGEFESSLPIRLVDEPTVGLSVARNRAIREANGSTLIFTDDDVEFDANWLRAFARAIESFPQAGFFGGRVLARWDGKPPGWFRAEALSLLSGVFVHQDCGDQSRWMDPSDPLPIGASFGIRREVWKRVGEFRADLGVAGRTQGRGEETEFLTRATSSGARGVYAGEALCWHPVDPERFRFHALLDYGRASGIAHREIRSPEARGSFYRAALHLLRGTWQAAKGRGDRFRQCVVNCGIELGLRNGAAR